MFIDSDTECVSLASMSHWWPLDINALSCSCTFFCLCLLSFSFNRAILWTYVCFSTSSLVFFGESPCCFLVTVHFRAPRLFFKENEYRINLFPLLPTRLRFCNDLPRPLLILRREQGRDIDEQMDIMFEENINKT